MKIQLILLLAALGCLAMVCLAVGPKTIDAAREQQAGRGNFVMPKLFDFEAFKQKFHRHYPSAVEQLRRAKIFMARAWAVFISAVKYTHRRSTKFLKLNPYSDWTKEEREALMNDVDIPQTRHSDDNDGTVSILGPEEIERLSAEVEARKATDPKFAALVAELEQGQTRGSPEATAATAERELIMGQLIGDENEEPEQMDLNEAAEGGNYFSSALSSVKSLFDKKKSAQEDAVERSKRINALKEYDHLEVDHRTSGCLIDPKRQRDCGACYAFGVTALLEYQYCMQTGKQVSFSEQYVVDCGYRHKTGGCKGGRGLIAYDFFRKFGLELTDDYPYAAREQTCPYEENTAAENMGRIRLADSKIGYVIDAELLKPANILHWLQKYGPLTIAVKTTDSFYDFGGGVDYLDCDPNKPKGHLMAIVGYGRWGTHKFWLIRNSFGYAYGLRGHYHLHTAIPPGCLKHIGILNATFVDNDQWKGEEILREFRERNPVKFF